MTSSDPPRQLDLDSTDLRISRGSTPASVQLAERLKDQILAQQLPPGGRLPTERELIEHTGLSRVTVRAAVGMLEKDGWLIRRQGLGTFVAEPVNQELTMGVRTITEVLVSNGVTPRVDVLSHAVVEPPPRVGDAMNRRRTLCIRRRYSDDHQPLALVTAYLPADLPDDVVAPLLTMEIPTETTYTMWEQRLGVRIGSATYEISAAAATAEVAAALDMSEGAPVLVLERTSVDDHGQPLEVVIFHHRPERYAFSVTLPRTSGFDAGMTETEGR